MQFAEEGRVYTTNPTRKYLERKVWKQPNENEVKALIPGTVISLETETGLQVKQGDLLLVFKAMKMHNKILSPKDGVVKSINVAIDQVFKKGDVLVVIE